MPDQHRCTGSVLETCNPSQTGFATVDDCGTSALCDAINKQCDICVPGTKQCSSSNSQTCASDGQSWSSTACTTCTGQGVCCIAGTEQCNGADDDCDGVADEGWGLGAACDGSDGDYCNEGTIVCNGPSSTTCTDSSGTNGEACNGYDDDCDGSTDEGYNLGVACDGADGDYCNEGTITCGGCTDNSGTNGEACSG